MKAVKTDIWKTRLERISKNGRKTKYKTRIDSLSDERGYNPLDIATDEELKAPNQCSCMIHSRGGTCGSKEWMSYWSDWKEK